MSTISVVIEFHARPGHAARLRDLLVASARQRAEGMGALRVDLMERADAPGRFVLVETFASQAAIDAFYATEAHGAFEREFAPHVSRQVGHDHHFLVGGP